MSLRSGINNMFTTLVHDDDQHVENSKLSTTPPVGHTLSVHTCGQLGAGKYLEHAGQRSAYPQSTDQSTTCGQYGGVILDTLTCLNGQPRRVERESIRKGMDTLAGCG